MTTKNDLRSVILSLGLGLVVTGMGVNAIACQNSSNRPPQPPLGKGGLSSHSLNNEGLSSDSPPLTKGGTQGGSYSATAGEWRLSEIASFFLESD